MEKETPCLYVRCMESYIKTSMLIVEKKGYVVYIITSILIVERTGLLYILKLVYYWWK